MLNLTTIRPLRHVVASIRSMGSFPSATMPWKYALIKQVPHTMGIGKLKSILSPCGAIHSIYLYDIAKGKAALVAFDEKTDLKQAAECAAAFNFNLRPLEYPSIESMDVLNVGTTRLRVSNLSEPFNGRMLSDHIRLAGPGLQGITSDASGVFVDFDTPENASRAVHFISETTFVDKTISLVPEASACEASKVVKASTRVTVSNLSANLTEEMLRDLFSEVGEVKSVILRSHGPSAEASVEFEEAASAARSVSAFHGSLLGRNTITVTPAAAALSGVSGSRCLVTNLPKGTLDSVLADLFSPFGRVVGIKFLPDLGTSSRAVVELASPEKAAEAIAALNSHKYKRRTLSVAPFVDTEDSLAAAEVQQQQQQDEEILPWDDDILKYTYKDVFVTNLPLILEKHTRLSFERLLSTFGTVKDVSYQSGGLCVVTYGEFDAVAAAVAGLNGARVGDAPIFATERLSKEDVAERVAERTTRQVFVVGLLASDTHADVVEHFKSCGEVVNVAFRHFGEGATKCNAFVEFANASSVPLALASLNYSSLNGNQISVREAMGRSARPRWSHVNREIVDAPAAAGGGGGGNEQRRLKVKNLPRDMSLQHLRELFAPVGRVVSVKKYYRGDGTFDRKCSIEFADAQEVLRAVNIMNGKVVDGSPIWVEVKKDEEPVVRDEAFKANHVARMECRVKVTGLQPSLTRDEVYAMFGRAGEVRFVNLFQTHGRFNGAAFAEYEEEASVERAIAMLDGQSVGGRVLKATTIAEEAAKRVEDKIRQGLASRAQSTVGRASEAEEPSTAVVEQSGEEFEDEIQSHQYSQPPRLSEPSKGPYTRRSARVPQNPAHQIHLSNLPQDITRGDLIQLLSSVGTVEDLQMFQTKDLEFRGACFVQFSSREEAKAAVETLHGSELDGKPLTARERLAETVGGFGGRPDRASGGVDSQVHVKNLPLTFSEADVRSMFASCGEVTFVKMFKDPLGTFKGSCFVEFAEPASVARAVKRLHNSEVQGHQGHLVTVLERLPAEVAAEIQAEQHVKQVYASNLDASITADELRGRFGEVGRVVDVILQPQKNPGDSRAAFVYFDTKLGAHKAKQRLDQTVFNSRRMRVEDVGQPTRLRAGQVARREAAVMEASS